MKKYLLLSLCLIGLLFGTAVKAQTTGSVTLVTTPTSSLQSFSSIGGSCYDSVNVASQSAAQIVPSGCLNITHYFSMSAAIKYTGVVTLPTSPVVGQSVTLKSNKAFYHLFTTSPAFYYSAGDTSGTNECQLIYTAKGWKCVK